MGTRETRKQQHTATTLLRAPEKKYDLLKEKKAAFGGKKGAVLTAAAAMAGKSKTEIAIFLTLFFTFFLGLWLLQWMIGLNLEFRISLLKYLLTKEILIISMQFSFVSLFEPFDQKKVTWGAIL